MCRIEILKLGCINSSVILPRMHMAEQLPYIFIAAIKAQKRIVIQIYLLFIHFYMHLHGHMLKPIDIPLPQVL